MPKMLEIGRFSEVATDATMAYEINRPSRSRSAVDARIQGVATDIIENSPAVIDAAAGAVTAAADEKGFLTQQQLGAVRTLASDDPQYAEVRLTYDYRRAGGVLRAGGIVDGGPGVAASVVPSGSGVVEMSRDFRRAQPGAERGGFTPVRTILEWLSRFGELAM